MWTLLNSVGFSIVVAVLCFVSAFTFEVTTVLRKLMRLAILMVWALCVWNITMWVNDGVQRIHDPALFVALAAAGFCYLVVLAQNHRHNHGHIALRI